MQTPDGEFKPLRTMYPDIPGRDAARLEEEMSGTLRRIAAAGGRDVPLFAVGDEIEVRGGKFKVLAFGGKLLVLEGVPRGGGQASQ